MVHKMLDADVAPMSPGEIDKSSIVGLQPEKFQQGPTMDQSGLDGWLMKALRFPSAITLPLA